MTAYTPFSVKWHEFLEEIKNNGACSERAEQIADEINKIVSSPILGRGTQGQQVSVGDFISVQMALVSAIKERDALAMAFQALFEFAMPTVNTKTTEYEIFVHKLKQAGVISITDDNLPVLSTQLG